MGDNTKYSAAREFVRAQPLSMTGPQVAKAATAAGIRMTAKEATQYRYLIRHEGEPRKPRPSEAAAAKRGRGRPPKPVTAALVIAPQHPMPAPPVRLPFTPGAFDAKEAQLRQLLFELGYDRVSLVLEEYMRLVRGDQ